MKLTVEIEFYCDGMDETDTHEILRTLETVFESGAESTCTELKLLAIIHV